MKPINKLPAIGSTIYHMGRESRPRKLLEYIGNSQIRFEYPDGRQATNDITEYAPAVDSPLFRIPRNAATE